MIFVNDLMNRLKAMGCRCTGFFFNNAIKEWQFNVIDTATMKYSYGYGATADDAAQQAVTDIEQGRPNTIMKNKGEGQELPILPSVTSVATILKPLESTEIADFLS